MGARSGGARPAWTPRSWEDEELDVDPSELARRIRAHGGEGLVDLDAPEEEAGAAGDEVSLPGAGAAGDERSPQDWVAARARTVGEQLLGGGEELRGFESELRARGLDAVASLLGLASDAVQRIGRSLQEDEADRWLAQVRSVLGEESWRKATGLAAELFGGGRQAERPAAPFGPAPHP